MSWAWAHSQSSSLPFRRFGATGARWVNIASFESLSRRRRAFRTPGLLSARFQRTPLQNLDSTAGSARFIRRPRLQSMIVDRHPDGKVIEALELMVAEPQRLMDRIIEVAADTRGPCTPRFGLRIQHLTHNARLEHGRSTARNETLAVGDLFSRCRPRLEQRIAETPLSLSFQVSDATQAAKLTTNAMAVEQILFNLIDNSCKYARDAADPRILCDVRVAADRVLIRVSDFGPGLSAAARKALFQPFQKSSTQATESAPGVGLSSTHNSCAFSRTKS
jgi:signal transduction histidine kinase